MSMFAKQTVTEPEDVNGAEAVRRRLRAWKNKVGSWASVVRDTEGLGHSKLEAFVGGDSLPTEVLQSLIAVAYHGHAVLDVATGKLKSANTAEPSPLCTAMPPAYDPNADSRHRPDPSWTFAGALRADDTKPPPATTTSRPGWAGVFPRTEIKKPDPPRRGEKFVRAPAEKTSS